MRDHHAELAALNVEVLGISFDAPAKNKAFKEKYGFRYRLLSDESHAVGVAYGAADSLEQEWPRRTSTIIDEEGRVLAHYPKVKSGEHLAMVLTELGQAVPA